MSRHIRSLNLVAVAALMAIGLGFANPATAVEETVKAKVIHGVATSGNTVALSDAKVSVFEISKTGSHRMGSTTTDGQGRFRVRVSGGTPHFVVVRGASHQVLAALLDAPSQRNVVVNELTTIAAAYATAQLADGLTITATPLQTTYAAGMAANLVNARTGRASSVIRTSPNGYETNTWRELGTLGNLLAACVRAKSDAKPCARLFSLTGLTSKATTWDAIQAIALHPTRHVRKLYDLSQSASVYSPVLTTKYGPRSSQKLFKLDAFTMAVKLNATGRTQSGDEVCPFGGLGNIAFNTNGYAWITNNVVQGTPNSSNCIVVLRPDGHPSRGRDGNPDSPLTGGGILGQGFGIGFDPTGRVWSGNFGWGGSAYEPTTDGTAPGGSVSLFNPDGTAVSGTFGYPSNVFRVQGTVSDANGNIWLAGYGNSVVQVLPGGNPDTTFPVYQDSNESPFDIRLDSTGDAWVSYTGSNAVSKLHYTPSGVEKVFSTSLGSGALPKGVAVDSQGTGWVAAGSQDLVHAFSSSGEALGTFNSGGINGPWGVSVDADDTLWVANFGSVEASDTKFGVSRLCGSSTQNCPAGMKFGDPMTPSTGFTLPSGGKQVLLHSGVPLNGAGSKVKVFQPLMRETAVQPDAAGNLWVTNNWKPGLTADATNPGGDGLVIFIGVAAPSAPKLYSGPPTRPE